MHEYGFDLNKIIEPEDKRCYAFKHFENSDGTYSWKREEIVENSREERKMEERNLPALYQQNPVQGQTMTNDLMRNDLLEHKMYNLMSEVRNVELTEEQKQKLKFRVGNDYATNYAYNCRKKIDLSYLLARKMIQQNIATSNVQGICCDENGIVVAGNPYEKQVQPITDLELIEKYIDFKNLVKERTRNSKEGYVILQRNQKFNRHEQVSKEELKMDFGEYFCSSRPDIEIPTSMIDKMFNTLLYKVKYIDDLIQERKMCQIAKYTVATFNGYYDLERDIFIKKETSDGHIFNKISLPINFLEEDVEPEKFEKLLKSSFGDDEMIINVFFEYLGAMLSGIPIIKKIFVLQGVSNGGKSRISRIIASCFHESDVIYIDKLTELKDEINLDNAMLIIIDELSDKKLNPSQVSNLKKLSNGSKQLKIIATTNNPISTESDGSVDKALYNRLAVIPFAQVMDSSDPAVSAYEDVYFEMERDAIASKALKAFHEVLTWSENISNLQFSNDYPLNGCIEKKIFPNECEEITIDPQRVQEVLRKKNQMPATEDVLKNVVAELYEITDEINPTVTTESIMQTVNEILDKDQFTDVQSFGKKLKGCYGDKLCSERKNGKMCYNFKYRFPEEPVYSNFAKYGD